MTQIVHPMQPPLESTLSLHSVEDFLALSDRIHLLELMRTGDLLTSFSDTRNLDVSVHELPGRSPKESAALYSPNGRSEKRDAPPAIAAILDDAFARSLRAIRAVFPTATTCSGWILVAYEAGQFIVPHVDLPDFDEIGRMKIAGMSVHVQTAQVGGEFFVESTAANVAWNEGGPAWRDTPGAFDKEFENTRRTRWITAPTAGDAVLYGSRLIHGTLPVFRGVSIKALTFLY